MRPAATAAAMRPAARGVLRSDGVVPAGLATGWARIVKAGLRDDCPGWRVAPCLAWPFSRCPASQVPCHRGLPAVTPAVLAIPPAARRLRQLGRLGQRHDITLGSRACSF